MLSVLEECRPSEASDKPAGTTGVWGVAAMVADGMRAGAMLG